MERRVATFYVSRASFFWNRPSERGNPLAKKRICKGKIGWIRQFGKKKKNNHLIDLEIKNSFLLLSFRLLNWRFMHCLIYSIVFLFLIIKKLRCPLIKYNNLKIVQRLLCFFFLLYHDIAKCWGWFYYFINWWWSLRLISHYIYIYKKYLFLQINLFVLITRAPTNIFLC